MNAIALLRALGKRERGPDPGEDVPPFGSAYRLDALDPQHIARYDAALGFEAGALPVPYYYLIAQRAHLATLLDDRFPFAIAGSVHVENALVEYLRPALDDAMDIVTTVQVEAPTETGARYCVLETVAGHAGKQFFSCRSRYLARRGQRKASGQHRDDHSPPPVVAQWTLSPSAGREYAAVSGDWNPIHLWTWSARLMGMRQPIIHGMHTVAKACAAIEGHTGRRVRSVEARFKAPIPLGSEASLAFAPGRNEYVVLCNGRVSVQGTLGLESPT